MRQFISKGSNNLFSYKLTDKKIKSIELKEALEYEGNKIPESPMDIEVSPDENIISNDDESQITIKF